MKTEIQFIGAEEQRSLSLNKYFLGDLTFFDPWRQATQSLTRTIQIVTFENVGEFERTQKKVNNPFTWLCYF